MRSASSAAAAIKRSGIRGGTGMVRVSLAAGRSALLEGLTRLVRAVEA